MVLLGYVARRACGAWLAQHRFTAEAAPLASKRRSSRHRVDEPIDDAVPTPADLERVAKNLKKLKYNRLVAVAKKVGVKQAVAPGVKKTGKQLAEEVSKVLNA